MTPKETSCILSHTSSIVNYAPIYMYHIHLLYSTCMLKCALNGHLEFLKFKKFIKKLNKTE